MKKLFVLDTNVLLSDPNSLFSFDEHDLIIPMVVLEELDAHKSRPDEVGRNARQVSRTLDDMRTDGTAGTGLVNGVQLPSGGTLKVVSIGADTLSLVPAEFKIAKVDNLIIGFMLKLSKDKVDATLVSKDINVRIKCDSLGIKCEDYLKMRVTSDPEKFYRGVDVVEVSEASINSFYEDGELLTRNLGRKFYPNQIVIIKYVGPDGMSKSAVTRCDDALRLVPVSKLDSVFGLKPRNKEQNFSLDLLLNPDIKLITLVGPSGTGKTLLALAAALDQLKSMPGSTTGTYEKLIVTRPVQPVGKDIGFLPGTIEEKMEPWIAPVRDNLNFLMGSQKAGSRRNAGRSKGALSDEPYLALLQQRGIVEIEAITFIRGRSIPNSFIVIDEAQNLSMHELKTIITRVGDGTKIVLTGDIEQIDNVHVDAYTNGLTYAVERFKDYPIAAHVTLIKGERSQLATLASQIL